MFANPSVTSAMSLRGTHRPNGVGDGEEVGGFANLLFVNQARGKRETQNGIGIKVPRVSAIFS